MLKWRCWSCFHPFSHFRFFSCPLSHNEHGGLIAISVQNKHTLRRQRKTYFLWSCCKRRNVSPSWFTHGLSSMPKWMYMISTLTLAVSPSVKDHVFLYRSDSNPCYEGIASFLCHIRVVRMLNLAITLFWLVGLSTLQLSTMDMLCCQRQGHGLSEHDWFAHWNWGTWSFSGFSVGFCINVVYGYK